MSIRAGDLDRRIAIQTPDPGEVDAAGARIPSWNDVGTVWANYRPVRDSERMASGSVTASIMARFQIRWSIAMSQIDERHRLLFDGRIFDIVAVKEIGRREGLEISATAGAERGPAA